MDVIKPLLDEQKQVLKDIRINTNSGKRKFNQVQAYIVSLQNHIDGLNNTLRYLNWSINGDEVDLDQGTGLWRRKNRLKHYYDSFWKK